ncbi:hypothetical protein ACFLXI_10005 [Chloroflexota bacterium]
MTILLAGEGVDAVTGTGIDCSDITGADCTEEYTYGSIITLKATADADSTFNGWGSACSGTGDCTVTMDVAVEVIAAFKKAPEPADELTCCAGACAGNASPLPGSRLL